MLLTLFNTARYQEHYRTGFWRDDTVYSLVKDNAARTPDAIAVQTTHGDLSYKELLEAADFFAVDLAERGVIAGQRVAVWLPSRLETVIAVVACSRNGFVCCPSLHRAHTVDEVVALLARMRAAAVVFETGYGADAETKDLSARLSAVDTLKQAYRLDKASGRKGVVEPKSADQIASCKPAPQDANRVLYLAFTSGTTGLPKGVMHSDNTLLANARALASDWSITDELSRLFDESLEPQSRLRRHDHGARGRRTDRDPRSAARPQSGRSARSIPARRFSSAFRPMPSISSPRSSARKLSGIGKLKGFRISGASAPREVVAELLAYGVVPQSGYGMTETCSHQYTLPDDDPRLIVESCGKSCPGYEIRIFDRENPDRELPPREIGQIGGRGASLMLGYFNDQAATRRFLQPRRLVHDRRSRVGR